jgi:hypothetical protein
MDLKNCRLKQSSAEIDANFDVVAKSMLPTVLRISDENMELILKCAAKRFVDADGAIDMSPTNIGKCISLSVNLLDFEVPPPPRPQPKEQKTQPDAQGATAESFRRSQHEQARDAKSDDQAKWAQREFANQVKEAEHNQVVQIIAETQSYISNTVRHPHSKGERLREKLRGIFDSGRITKMNPEQAQRLFDLVKHTADQVD